MSDESGYRQEILEVGRRLYDKGFVASNDGNISIRISENELLITPTGVSKGFMSSSDIIKVNMRGEVIEGTRKPSSEIKMHLAVYRMRPDVKAIVHAHPQKATAFAVANIGFDRITLPEVVFSLGFISLTEYGTPSTNELPEAVEKQIATSDALLLANHGALTVGGDLLDAYYKMETLEHFAAISIYARMLGGEKALNESQTEKLFKVRSEVFGKKNPQCTGCGACGKPKGESSCNPIQTNPVQKTINESIAESKTKGNEANEDDVREAIKKLVIAELKKMSI